MWALCRQGPCIPSCVLGLTHNTSQGRLGWMEWMKLGRRNEAPIQQGRRQWHNLQEVTPCVATGSQGLSFWFSSNSFAVCVYLRMGTLSPSFLSFYPAQGTWAAVPKPWLKTCPTVGREALRKVESLWAGNGEGLDSASAREAGRGCGNWLDSLLTLHKNREPGIFISTGGGNKGELWGIKQFFLLKWL